MATLICCKHFVSTGTDRKVYQNAFPSAKLAKKSQRANYLFVEPPPPYVPVLLFVVIPTDSRSVQTQDLIFKVTESNSALLNTGAGSVGKMELPAALWAHFGYLFLWEGSPEPDYVGVWRRLLQSVFKAEWSTFSAKLPFVSRMCARDREIFRPVFYESGFK
ncbi:hypothetical protein J7J18_02425 [bacterium]|nr:hypothetical protein [bacterium]